MNKQSRLNFLLLLLLAPVTIGSQSDGLEVNSRLPWGDPNLQGIYLYQTLTPLERPEQFAGIPTLSPDEAIKYQTEQHEAVDRSQLRGDWIPKPLLTNGRTSQIIKPEHGRLPEHTPAGQNRAKTIGSPTADRGYSGPEDRERLERCVMGRSVPLLARTFEQRVQIYQTPRFVVLHDELGEIRIIPIDGRERLPASIRQWGGQSIGHWDKDTLVIETTHLNEKWSLFGSGPNMQLIERISWRSAEALDYVYTVNDPESFTKPWTVLFPLISDPGPVYEFACHEGNQSMPLILRGARLQER